MIACVQKQTNNKQTSLSEPCQKNQVFVIKDQQAKITHILLAANSGRIMEDYVFTHESSTFPPALTQKGTMSHGSKGEILDCIVPMNLDNNRSVATAAVLDGAVLIQILRPRSARTISDYFKEEFVSIHPFLV